jgi:hypothetical protein
VVYGCYNVEFEFAIGSGLENARVDLDLFDTRAIEFFEGCDDASLFAGTGWTVYEEMWEVAALCLWKDVRLEDRSNKVSNWAVLTRARRRSDSSGW